MILLILILSCLLRGHPWGFSPVKGRTTRGMYPKLWSAGKSFSVVFVHECPWQSVGILGYNIVISQNSVEARFPKCVPQSTRLCTESMEMGFIVKQAWKTVLANITNFTNALKALRKLQYRILSCFASLCISQVCFMTEVFFSNISTSQHSMEWKLSSN